jgi:hypothetical protein
LRAALVTSRHFASERAPNQLFADQSHQQYAWSASKEAHSRALFCLEPSAKVRIVSSRSNGQEFVQ